jgi:hypothetical protein
LQGGIWPQSGVILKAFIGEHFDLRPELCSLGTSTGEKKKHWVTLAAYDALKRIAQFGKK